MSITIFFDFVKTILFAYSIDRTDLASFLHYLFVFVIIERLFDSLKVEIVRKFSTIQGYYNDWQIILESLSNN